MLFPTRSSSAWKPPPATRENLYHELQERGYVLRLLHPRQALRAKTDRLDAMTIAKVLLSGEARAGYVPSERVTAYRELVRLHMQLSDEAAAYQNEIHALVIVLFQEFINEVSTTFRLQHPNIVRLLDFGIGADDTPFLAMDYAPNGTLRQRNPKGTRLPLDTIVTYIRQIATALQYAHDKRRVHRDVKPDNILLGANNEVLLSDFGIASVAHGTQSLNTQKEAGSVPYMAPEQLQGKPRPASDQYALGIIVYEWLCGERPFNGAYWEIVSQHLSTPPPSFKKDLKISPEVEQVVMMALAKDPHQRFASVQAFANALEQACQPKPPIGTTLLTYRGHIGGANSVAWSPDGRYIASGSGDGTVQVWDATTGATILTYGDHSWCVCTVAWSPDGRHIASSSNDGTVQVWDASTGAILLTYDGHADPVNAVAWSPDGKCIASSSNDGTVQVWSTATGGNLLTYGSYPPDDEYP